MADMKVQIVKGDITKQQVDAIVNAANSSLLGGGGVDGAIHRAAGPGLHAACQQLRATKLPHGLPVGQAVATQGYDLPAKWIIHTVGPNAHRGQTDPKLLESCFANSLDLARQMTIQTIAFPAISSGAYGWSGPEVARCAFNVVRAIDPADPPVQEIRFVLFSDDLLADFQTEQDSQQR
jgi:O-acetyl-ADP-ribose deacetylase (regulator of RNase III)